MDGIIIPLNLFYPTPTKQCQQFSLPFRFDAKKPERPFRINKTQKTKLPSIFTCRVSFHQLILDDEKTF
ncbi:hypothetical protein Hdeb2414_s0009g00319141 [Helianthus debilis subsp. tardiflorus]